MNRNNEITNLFLDAVKEGITDAEFGPNYLDRTSDLAQSMKIRTTVKLSRFQRRMLSQKFTLLDRTVKPSIRVFISHRTGKGKRPIKGKKNCPRSGVMAEKRRQLKLGKFATGKTICLNAFEECRD